MRLIMVFAFVTTACTHETPRPTALQPTAVCPAVINTMSTAPLEAQMNVRIAWTLISERLQTGAVRPSDPESARMFANTLAEVVATRDPALAAQALVMIGNYTSHACDFQDPCAVAGMVRYLAKLGDLAGIDPPFAAQVSRCFPNREI